MESFNFEKRTSEEERKNVVPSESLDSGVGLLAFARLGEEYIKAQKRLSDLKDKVRNTEVEKERKAELSQAFEVEGIATPNAVKFEIEKLTAECSRLKTELIELGEKHHIDISRFTLQ